MPHVPLRNRTIPLPIRLSVYLVTALVMITIETLWTGYSWLTEARHAVMVVVIMVVGGELGYRSDRHRRTPRRDGDSGNA